MNVDAVKMDGQRCDQSGYHRAVDVARELCAAGLWNGQDRITIFDPYVTHNKVFGVGGQSITALRSGVDYLIHEPAVLHDAPPRVKVEDDGDILWAL